MELKTNKKTEIPLLADKLTINDIDLITGTEFESFLVELFKGVDIVASKNNYKLGILEKCYSGTVSK